MKQQLNQSVH